MVTKSKTVTGSDGRTWTVRRRMEWSMPATGEEFEHDVDGGRAAAVLILSTLGMFYVALFSWMPADVHVPWWVVLAGTRSTGSAWCAVSARPARRPS
jgi:uncharacterized protein (DUF983 family)